MAGSRGVQGSVSGSLPIVAIFDKFGKHGLAGLTIAALLYVSVIFHGDSVEMSTTTIKEVTISATALRNSTDELRTSLKEHTDVLKSLNETLRHSRIHDTVYIISKARRTVGLQADPKKLGQANLTEVGWFKRKRAQN